ncbi:MAG TPA: Glu/Leu/Phe/Val dehydrogenase dimerization domain-containing protein [Candidatus Binatia bacterium]|nr:Glu/Leu/Phe/Val dehydrogenase dimerization domain-containing protein [Candidatus Binatia bacterium]
MTAPALAAGPRHAEPPAARLVWRVTDDHGPLGALVIDDVVAHRACGGLRIAAAVTDEELRELATVMTLKFAFFGIACGGAKAGFVVPETASAAERRRRARTFGAALGPLLRAGSYIPGTDLGCGQRDLWEVLDGAGVPVGTPPTGPVETSGTAGFSGRSAAIAALAALGGRARDATLAVLGYGRVGAALAARFTAAGGRLVGIATARAAAVRPDGFDPARLERLRGLHGDDLPLHYPGARPVERDVLLGLGVDVLSPCATAGMIDAERARRVRCRILCAGANAAVTADAEPVLEANGTTVLPDFVTNAGGVLVSHFWPLALSERAVDTLLERRFRAVVDDLLRRAAAAGTTPATLARGLAGRNLARLRRAPANAVRHERLFTRLGRGRLRHVLPSVVVNTLVLRVARDLGPPTE